jgi:hypothetical protein
MLAKAAENWPAKVLSVVLAIFLFVFHRISALEERFFSVPLTLERSADLVPSSSYPRIARISLKGETNSIFLILESDIEVFADLSAYTEAGSYQVPVNLRKKGTALGIEPLEIRVEPQEIRLELDHWERKSVSITPNFRGYPVNGYELISYTLDPSRIDIEGPRKLLDTIHDLSTDYIEMQGRSDTFTSQIHILNRDPLITMEGNGMVEIRCFIQEIRLRRNFENIPIQIRGLEDDFEFEFEDGELRGTLNLEGSQNFLESFSPSGGVLYVDCSSITRPGFYTLPVHADVPPNVVVRGFEPASIDIEIHSGFDGDRP